MKNKILFKAFLLLGFTFSFIIPLHPGLRTIIKNTFNSEHREVLSIIQSDLTHSKNISYILKIRTHEGLLIEIYGDNNSKQTPSLLDRIFLEDHRDGYFNFNGESTNLAIEDINGDNRMEVIVPSFNKNFMAKLNIYQFNPDIQKLEEFNFNI